MWPAYSLPTPQDVFITWAESFTMVFWYLWCWAFNLRSMSLILGMFHFALFFFTFSESTFGFDFRCAADAFLHLLYALLLG
jgi:hypothetical protein